MSRLRAVVARVVPDWATGLAGPALGAFLDRRRVPPYGLRHPPGDGRGSGALLPTVLVLQLGGAQADAVSVTVEHLARVAPQVGVRPVLVLDGGYFQLARRGGVVVDHVVAAPDWARRHPDVPYSTYLAGRLSGLRADYATDHLVSVGPDGWAGVGDDDLAGWLRPPAVGAARRVALGVVGRVEGLLDRSAP